jgi:glycosyltransferase involved in cell wall biosynthesis
MKFSIITVTKNSERFIEKNIRSVMTQKYVDLQHIIKDANSSDSTIAIARLLNPKIKFLIESDVGIYDAMNQAFKVASGDCIAFLNSDDFYCDDMVLYDVNNIFCATNCDYVYGDISMQLDGKLRRAWTTGFIKNGKFCFNQIPHPALFIKKSVLNNISGPFDSSYRIAADLKLQLILRRVISARGSYIPRPLVYMSIGGASTRNFSAYFQGWRESYRAWSEICGEGGIYFVFIKVFLKVFHLRF